MALLCTIHKLSLTTARKNTRGTFASILIMPRWRLSSYTRLLQDFTSLYGFISHPYSLPLVVSLPPLFLVTLHCPNSLGVEIYNLENCEKRDVPAGGCYIHSPLKEHHRRCSPVFRNRHTCFPYYLHFSPQVIWTLSNKHIIIFNSS